MWTSFVFFAILLLTFAGLIPHKTAVTVTPAIHKMDSTNIRQMRQKHPRGPPRI